MRILIIRPGAIGDALLTFHILRALRNKYSQCHITFVSNVSVLPLARAWGLAEETFDFQDWQWAELFLLPGIEHKGIEVGAASGRSQESSLQKRFQHIDLAICWLRIFGDITKQNLLAAGVREVIVAPGHPRESERIHIVEHLARTIGLQDEAEGNRGGGNQGGGQPRPYHITRGTSISYMVGVGLAPALAPGPTYGMAIHPGSGSPRKCWPVGSFAAVIQQLIEQNISVLLLAGPADSERVNTILRLLAPFASSGMLKVLDNAPLLEVARWLQGCRGYLGNDSGITHLAAMLGVPTIALFGPTDPATWHPVGPSVEVMQVPLLEDLSVDVVMEAIHTFFKEMRDSTSG